MKVRLKHLSQRRIFSSKWFQFHEGPIKAYYDYKTNYDIVLFQFHEGPIKATNLVAFAT